MPPLLLTGRVGKLSGKMRVKKAVRKVQKFMGWGRYNVIRQVKKRRVRAAKSLYQYEPTAVGKKRLERMGARQQEWNRRAINKAIRQGAMKSVLYGTAIGVPINVYGKRLENKRKQKAAATRAVNKARRS